MLSTLNSIAGLIAVFVGVILAWVQMQVRSEIALLRQEVMAKDAEQLKLITAGFIRKPDLNEDWPVPRREFVAHVADDIRMHESMNVVLDRFHQRFRQMESDIMQLGIHKEDRADSGMHNRRHTDMKQGS